MSEKTHVRSETEIAGGTITVTTLSDTADPPFDEDFFCGAVTVDELPGDDGLVSLREAIIAANNTPGTWTITFEGSLSGGTIFINFDNLDENSNPNALPPFCGGNTTIDGDINGDGVPDVTLDGSALPSGSIELGNFFGIRLLSSNNVVRGLAFANFLDGGIAVNSFTLEQGAVNKNIITRNTVRDSHRGILVEGGSRSAQSAVPGLVTNTTVAGNTVERADFVGIWVATGDAAGSFVRNTTVTDNVIGEGIQNGIYIATNHNSDGSNTTIADVSISDNKVTGNDRMGIAVSSSRGSKNTIRGVIIKRNIVSDNTIGIGVIGGEHGADENQIKAIVSQNTVKASSSTGILLTGGFSGQSDSNTTNVQVTKNKACGNAESDIYAVGGFLGNSDFASNQGAGNQVVGSISDNVANIIRVENGVPGNTVTVQNKKNRDCREEYYVRPIPLGLSGGNVNKCRAGTLGALVENTASEFFILSNNHVLALSNAANIGDDIIQPGSFDAKCLKDPEKFPYGVVADLTKFQPIVFGLTPPFTNRIDAAIAKIRDGQVDISGRILEVGIPGSIPIAPAIGLKVKKSGRSTGLTHGIIEAVAVTVFVNKLLTGHKALFTGQIRISGTDGSFSDKGDSGSLIVEDTESCPRPIGLLFAEDNKSTLANPIDAVFDILGVSAVGCQTAAQVIEQLGEGESSSLMELGPTNPAINHAREVKERYDSNLLEVPGVVGTGIGLSKKNGQVVIEVYVKKLDPNFEALLPETLEGIPVKKIITEGFHSS